MPHLYGASTQCCLVATFISWERLSTFICDTSYRHSYCLDQFQKSASAPLAQRSCTELQTKPTCPLCQGVITGWDVVPPARRFMNSKTRTCALETCDFNGNYDELRKHGRCEHPSRRPSEASPTRQSNRERLELDRDIEDAFAHQSEIEYVWGGWPSFHQWLPCGLMNTLFISRVEHLALKTYWEMKCISTNLWLVWTHLLLRIWQVLVAQCKDTHLSGPLNPPILVQGIIGKMLLQV